MVSKGLAYQPKGDLTSSREFLHMSPKPNDNSSNSRMRSSIHMSPKPNDYSSNSRMRNSMLTQSSRANIVFDDMDSQRP